MKRDKNPTHRRSVAIPQELFEWIAEEAAENNIDVNAQIKLMLSKAKRLIEEEENLGYSLRTRPSSQPEKKNHNG